MFFIVNKTKRTIIFSDLNVTLGPRQAIDLDKVVDRKKSDASKFLKSAKKKGVIEVRMKDGEKPKYLSYKSPEGPSLDSFKNEIISEMKGTMRDLLAQQVGNVQSTINSDDLEEMTRKIIQSIPRSTETVIIKEKAQEEGDDEKVEIDEETLAKINARAVDEIVKDTKVKSIHYKEERQEDTILDNVEELENLLG